MHMLNTHIEPSLHVNSHPFSSLLGTLQRQPCGSRRSGVSISLLPRAANRTSSRVNMLITAYAIGLEQYPTIIGFNLPLNFPPGMTNMGDTYTSM